MLHPSKYPEDDTESRFSTQYLNIASKETELLQIRLMLIQDWLRRENDDASDSLKTILLWKQEIK